ncbi:MAG TPA: molybdopterin-synthase adenylyltransferase MoeB [Gemmatimonadales bacterium]|nr:molybdopterin-synthase adenylyltransferase MoeB [Gemmatimonadales bacterium]
MTARTSTGLSHEEVLRYSRHLILPEVGAEGQAKLKNARVLLVGAGGLGSPAALYLAAAGVGTLGVVDADRVDASNLQRQVLHGTSDVGRPKTESAADRLREINPHVEVVGFSERLTSANGLEILRPFDVIVDGSDNFPTRYLVNDACVLLGKPDIYGAIFRFDGQASVFGSNGGPCYRCLFADPPPPDLVPSCAEAGVLGVLPGIIGSIQAAEAIKLILGIGESLAGRLLLFDALKLEFRELAIARDPECPVCGTRPTVKALIDYEAFCGMPGAGSSATEVTVREFSSERGQGKRHLVVDVREPYEVVMASFPEAVHIPLRQLPGRLAELDAHLPVVTVCHHGQRSMRAREILVAAGFGDVRSLAGGIDAWSREIDSAVPRY